jgi:O-antigen/teichoic acid export membrane protein
MHRLLANLGWLLGARGINAGFSLVYLAVTTRSLGVEGFGRFVLVVVMAQLVAGLASFSTWQGIVRWGMQPGEAGRAAGFAVALDLASLIAGTLLALAAVWTAPIWLPLPHELRPACLMLCLVMLLCTRSTPTGILRLHDRYDLATAAESALPATRMAGALLAAVALPGIEGFVLAWAVAELACAAAHWRFALRLQAVRLADISLFALPARHAGAWRFVWATNLSRSLAVMSKQMLQLLAGASGGPALAGGFRIASQLGTALVQFGDAVSRALYPELVRAGDGAEALARRVAAIAIAAGVLATGLSMLIGEAALTLIAGSQFAFAAPAMSVLALAGALELLAASWDSLLVARGEAGRALLLRAAPMAGSLALILPATASYGLMGTAGCVLLASTLTALGLAQAALWRRPIRSGSVS